MDNNILLSSKDVIFEPHISKNNDLPFIYHYDRAKKSAIANIHENIELLFFTNGTAHVRYDSNLYSVKKNDVVIVNSYSAHQVIPNGPVDFFCLIIDKTFCKYHSIDCNALTFKHVVCDNKLNEILNQLINEINNQSTFKHTAIKSHVLQALLYLCQNYSKPKTDKRVANDSSFEYVRKAVEYIKNNLSRKLSVEDVASYVGISKYYFLREFKKITGCTFTGYVNLIRCEYARELLSSGKHAVKEVAMLCGFDNYSYFATVFKKNTSLLPSEYMNKSR